MAERMTPGMLVQLKDKELIRKHGEEPCMILRVQTKKEPCGVIPVNFVLSSLLLGTNFEALPHQIRPYDP